MIFNFLRSPLFTLILFVLTILLIFIGSIAQAYFSNFDAVQNIFYSFFLSYRFDFLPLALPLFPGGFTLAFFWCFNLLSLFYKKIPFKKRFLGLWVLHLALLSLIVQLAFENFYKEEGQIFLTYGKPVNFATSSEHFELTFTDPTNPRYDEIHTLDFSTLKEGKRYTLSKLKLELEVMIKLDHSQVFFEKPELGAFYHSSHGQGKDFYLQKKKEKADKKTPALIVKFYSLEKGTFLGEYLFSQNLPFFESLLPNGAPFLVHLQRKRIFFPFTFNLLSFKREIHSQTDIPKSFSSLIEVYSQDSQLQRLSLIYMNQPLIFDHYTFYQASYSQDENTTILQAVINPYSWAPYISCSIMGIALLGHLSLGYYYSNSRRRRL
jgi:hypothetical protein